MDFDELNAKIRYVDNLGPSLAIVIKNSRVTVTFFLGTNLRRFRENWLFKNDDKNRVYTGMTGLSGRIISTRYRDLFSKYSVSKSNL